MWFVLYLVSKLYEREALKNLTQLLKRELMSRNPAYLFAEDLPEIEADCDFYIKDEFGFGIRVKDVSFEKLNYLLSVLISSAVQESKDEEGMRFFIFSCKVQKVCAHLTEKADCVEILILQDSDEKPIAVEMSMGLIEQVGGALEEINQEITDIMTKLKAKSNNNEMFDEEFNKLSDALNAPLKKSESYQGLMNDVDSSFDSGKGFDDLPDLIMKLNELDQKFKRK